MKYHLYIIRSGTPKEEKNYKKMLNRWRKKYDRD